MKPRRLDWSELTDAYAADATTVADTVRTVLERVRADGVQPVWISIFSEAELLARAGELAAWRAEAGPTWRERYPLWGLPCAVKDNIDVFGLPTTAACPAFAYQPAQSAEVVRRLEAAGALVIGKTNLDQFAAGLVGVRSPYGACRNPHHADYVAGGSSSGSAVAVAAGHVCFALGTDTAGSGRVPAGFNGLVGYKPTRGAWSTRGVVPACRTLDCVTVFAARVAEARQVAAVVEGFDEQDPFSRQTLHHPHPLDSTSPASPAGLTGCAAVFRFGVPRPEQREFFGDAAAARAFARALDQLEAAGGTAVEIDFAPFAEAARLLYEGPWLAERLHAVQPLLARDPEAIWPVTRGILERGVAPTALDAFRGEYALRAVARRAMAELARCDVLVVPTAPMHPTLAQVEAEPVAVNTRLGTYTNFVNLLDLAAVAVPAGWREDGLPAGITLIGPAWSDGRLLAWAERFAGGDTARPTCTPGLNRADPGVVSLAVVGAHLSGLPLNHQLLDAGGRLIRVARTARQYRMFALRDVVPPKPGLVRVPPNGTTTLPTIEVEVWEIPTATFGAFVAAVPPPLTIGTVELDDGTRVKGFLCEGCAVEGALDISTWGGWRAYLGRACA